ncbi:MAG: hypothetical protein B7Z74_03040 [Deltaproteobacteria bacterium 21-66-5]|nr:MAG: hypothetical protein B7Z74_03040 [Deltaproteobacteria bacterium 21-66-5]
MKRSASRASARGSAAWCASIARSRSWTAAGMSRPASSAPIASRCRPIRWYPRRISAGGASMRRHGPK